MPRNIGMNTFRYSETLYFELAYANAYTAWYLHRRHFAQVDQGAITYWWRFCESAVSGVKAVQWI